MDVNLHQEEKTKTAINKECDLYIKKTKQKQSLFDSKEVDISGFLTYSLFLLVSQNQNKVLYE